jgi:rare lipoprotein A
MQQRLCKTGFVVCWLLILTACSSTSDFARQQDAAPNTTLDAEKIVDAVPRVDPVTRAGNKNPYVINGKTYHLLPTSAGYNQRGVASWYGTKFHGRPTANGETYSLYEMTAAHTTLPIPCYVKVTNLSNGRTAIVRVNDRGPFHGNRIIDLSYAAAVKLGYAEKGTAYVQVEVIDPSAPAPFLPVAKPAPTPKPAEPIPLVVVTSPKHYLQAGAFKNRESAQQLKQRLETYTEQSVLISQTTATSEFYRVRVGPLATIDDVQRVSQQLRELQLSPHLVTE